MNDIPERQPGPWLNGRLDPPYTVIAMPVNQVPTFRVAEALKSHTAGRGRRIGIRSGRRLGAVPHVPDTRRQLQRSAGVAFPELRNPQDVG